MDAPFFSVIIPVYNKERYLKDTLNSVLRQSFKGFEMILVLDPSTDRSSEIAQSFDDNRIRVYKRDTPGPGGYAARNLGIMEAVGEWIAFIDADDLWYTDHLQALYKAIQDNGFDYDVFCTGYVTEKDGKKSESRYLKQFRSTGSHSFDFEKFLLYKPINTINAAIRRVRLMEIGGFPTTGFKRGGDHETWLRLIALVRRGFWVSEVTALYNKNVDDSVIKSTMPYTSGHPVFIMVRQMIRSESDTRIVTALKRYSNTFVITGIKSRIKLGALFREDIQSLYSEVFDRKFQLAFFRIFVALPPVLQRFISKIL